MVSSCPSAGRGVGGGGGGELACCCPLISSCQTLVVFDCYLLTVIDPVAGVWRKVRDMEERLVLLSPQGQAPTNASAPLVIL